MASADKKVHWARASYDHRRDSKAVGTVVLRGDRLPAGAIILDSLIHVHQAPDSADDTATIALGAESSTTLQAATAVSGAPWSTTGAKRGAIDADTAPVITTKARNITATIAVQAITAGKFTVYVRYLKP